MQCVHKPKRRTDPPVDVRLAYIHTCERFLRAKAAVATKYFSDARLSTQSPPFNKLLTAADKIMDLIQRVREEENIDVLVCPLCEAVSIPGPCQAFLGLNKQIPPPAETARCCRKLLKVIW